MSDVENITLGEEEEEKELSLREEVLARQDELSKAFDFRDDDGITALETTLGAIHSGMSNVEVFNKYFGSEKSLGYEGADPVMTPGLINSFAQGLMYEQYDFFNTKPGEVDPTTFGEHAAKFGGSMVPIIAAYLGGSVVGGSALAASGQTSLTARLMVEIGANAIAEVPAFIALESSKKEIAAATGVNIALSMLLPLPGGGKGLDILKGGKQSIDAAITQASKKADVLTEDAIVNNMKKVSDSLSTDGRKLWTEARGIHGDNALTHMDALNQSMVKWDNEIVEINRAVTTKMDKVRLTPVQRAYQAAEASDVVTKNFIDKVGGLSAKELEEVQALVGQYDNPVLSNTLVNKRLARLADNPENETKYLERLKKEYGEYVDTPGMERIQQRAPFLADSTRKQIIDNINYVESSGRQYIPGEGSIFDRALEDLGHDLKEASENLAAGINWKSSFKERQKYANLMGTIQEEVDARISQSAKIQALVNDMRTLTNTLRDDGVVAADGMVDHPVFKEFTERTMHGLVEAIRTPQQTDAFFERLLRTTESVVPEKVQADLAQARQQIQATPAMQDGQYRRIVDQIQTRGTIPDSVDSKDFRRWAQKSVAGILTDNDHILEELDPTAYRTYSELKARIKDSTGIEKRNLEQQYKSAIDQYSQVILADYGSAKKVASRTSDPSFSNMVTAYHAAQGDPIAGAVVQQKAQQQLGGGPRVLAEHRLSRNYFAKDNPDGTAIPDSIDPKIHLMMSDAFENMKKDMGGLERLFGSPKGAAQIRLEASKAVGSDDTPVWQGLTDYLEDLEQARINFLNDNDELVKRLNTWGDNVRAAGKTKEQEVFNFIDEIDQISNKMLDEDGLPASEVEEYISKRLGEVDPWVKEQYQEYRAMDDWIIQKYNDGVDEVNAKFDTNLPYANRRPGHVSYMYEGSYRLRVVDQDGNNINQVFVRDKESAAKALNALFVRNKGGWDDVRVILEPRHSDDIADILDETAYQVVRDTEKTFGVSGKDIKNKLNIEGEFTADNLHRIVWGGEKDRVLGLENLRLSAEKAIAVSGRLALRHSNYMPTVLKGQEVVKMLGDNSLHKWANYVKTLTDDVLGRSRKMEHEWDEIINSTLSGLYRTPGSREALGAMGLHENSRAIRSVVSGLTFLGRMASIGFNAGTAIVQTFILPTNVAPVLGFRNTLKGLRGLAGAGKNERLTKLLTKAGINYRHAGRTPSGFLFQDMLAGGKYTRTQSQKLKSALDYYGMYMFNHAETNIRAATVLAGIEDGTQRAAKMIKGKDKLAWQDRLLKDIADKHGLSVSDDAVIDQYAIDIMKRTNFTFDVTDLSEVARNPFLKPFSQFKTYFFKEMEFLFFGRHGNLSKTEQFKALGMLTGLGGMFALPFVEDMDTVATAAFGKSPRLWFYENMPDVLSAGLPTLVGLDVSQVSNLGGVRGMNLYNQPILLSKTSKAYSDIKTGRRSFVEGMARISTPVRNLMDSYDLLTYGKVLNPTGTATERTGGALEAAANVFGFKTPKTMIENHRYHTGRTLLRINSAKRNRVRNRVIDAVRAGDTAKAAKLAKSIDENYKDIIKQTTKPIGTKLPKKIQEEVSYGF